MKYSIELTDDGCRETLEFRGRTYTRDHEGDGSHTSTGDKDFWEQLEKDGVEDEIVDKFLYIFDTLSSTSFLGLAEEE